MSKLIGNAVSGADSTVAVLEELKVELQSSEARLRRLYAAAAN